MIESMEDIDGTYIDPCKIVAVNCEGPLVVVHICGGHAFKLRFAKVNDKTTIGEHVKYCQFAERKVRQIALRARECQSSIIKEIE